MQPSEAEQGHLPDLTKETVCWSQKLDAMFLSHTAEFTASGNYKRSELPTMYFGAEDIGMMRQFPGRYGYTSPCGGYDPRTRPWYTNSMSPPKDVIILIDASGSMKTADEDGVSTLDHALATDKYMIEHFSAAESFAV